MSNDYANLFQMLDTTAGDSLDIMQILQEMIEAISEGFVLYDADDRLVVANAKYREIYGLSADLIVPGNSFEQIIRAGAERGEYADAIGRVDEWVAERMQRHRDPSGPIEQHLTDGRWLRITEHKTPSGWIAGLRVDITELKQAEEAARLSEQRYRRLVERTNTITYSYNVGEADLSYVAPQASKLLGYSLTDLRSGQFWFDHMHPDDRPEVIRQSEARAQATEDHSLEYRMITADERVIWLRDIVSFDCGPDGVLTAHGVIIDITEEKRSEAALSESEQRFRYLADTTPAMLWLDDAAGKTTFLNRAWLEYTGRSLEAELGDGWYDNVNPYDLKHVIPSYKAACARLDPVAVEYRLRGKDGQFRWFLDVARPRFSPDGEYLGYIGVLIDIDERRQLQAQLAQAQKMEAVGQLTGGVAHNFNNLLTVITLNLQSLETSMEEGDERNDWIKAALHAAEQGADRTYQLLAFSRSEVREPKIIDVGEVFDKVKGLLHHTLFASIDIRISSAIGLWSIEIDPEQLENALLNLGINARDAMPDGGILTIEAANECVDGNYASRHIGVKAGEYVTIVVTDTGVGMSQEAIDRACEPFFTTKEVNKGSGLSLSMVHSLMKQCGGHVGIESELGVGTTVKLHVPRSRANDPTKPSVVSSGSAPSEAIGTETILVVESDGDIRSKTVSVLGSLGYHVLQAPDGESALSIMAQSPDVDLLFTEVAIGDGMNGASLAAQIRARARGVKVLYTSERADDASVQHVSPGQHGSWIGKPYRALQLVEKIRQVLNS